MIKNEQQYKMAKTHAANFEKAMTEVKNEKAKSSIHPILAKAEIEALNLKYNQLVSDIQFYEELKTGKLGVIEVGSFDKLPEGLIQSRIAKGLSQKELAEKLGLKEQQIQRYEATNYATASLERLNEIINALELKINKEIFISDALFSKSIFFKSLKKIGLDSDVVLKRIIPKELSLIIEDINNISEVEAKNALLQAVSFVGRIFKISPDLFFKPDLIALNLATASAVRYKKNANTSESKTSAYTMYAHTLALLTLDCFPDVRRKKVPEASEVRKTILKKEQNITLKGLLNFVWDLGIPVLPLKDSGSFHGACWRVDGKNVIVLKQKTNSESRWIFDLSHELCHAGQYPNQQSFEIVEQGDESKGSVESQDELDANYYAGEVALGDKADDLAVECILDAKRDLAKLKVSVSNIAKRDNVDQGVLANYIAFRLQTEQSKNWWGAASNLQKVFSDPFEITKQIFMERINLEYINSQDRELILRALT